jgi:hypothetical protein
MEVTLLSDDSLRIAGVLILAVATIAYGGTFVLRVTRGGVPATEFQRRFYRAGHAHAGVLVILALVTQPYVDAAGISGLAGWLARSGVAVAAILMPAGFFLSVLGRDVQRPNRLIVLLWAGAATLVAGVLTLGVGLLLAI